MEVLFQNASDKWPKSFTCRFIEPGLVSYNESGTEKVYLVQKNTLDKMAQSMVGKPVYYNHQKASPKDFSTGKADGIVSRVWYNTEDGWYWADFLSWDDNTREFCASGKYFVSCAYTPKEGFEATDLYHNVRYDAEITDGEYTHLAVVPEPRYAGAFILQNSKEGGNDMFKFWKKTKNEKGEEVLNSSDLEEGTAIAIGDKKVPLKDLIELHNAEEAKKASILPDDAFIQLENGKKITIAELKVLANKKNEYDEKDKEKEEQEKDNAKMADEHKNGGHKTFLKNCAMCNAAEKDETEKKEKEKEKENSAHFTDLEKINHNRQPASQGGEGYVSLTDKVAEGRKRYGKIEQAA